MRLAVVAATLAVSLIACADLRLAAAAELSPNIAQRHINCTCRANGRSYHVGDQVCLSTAKGYRMAQCQMQQNVTNWLISPDDCSVSSRLWVGAYGRAG